MQFPVYFKRRVGAGNDPVLGSDSAPIVTTPKKSGDNVMSHKLSRPMKRIAVGYWTDAAAPVTLPVSIWVWDAASEKWYRADAGTLTNGQVTYLKCPSLCDPPQTQANLKNPQHGVDVLIIVSDNTATTGTYHFVAGPDAADF